MSRSGYVEDWDDPLVLGRYRGRVASALRGKRGQAFLKEMLAALDALPEKKLVANDLEKDDCVCAIGAVGRRRGVDMKFIDPEDAETVSGTFGIAEPMAREIVYENDQGGSRNETSEQRFARVRAWVAGNILQEASA